jgi:hypothetical protein
MARRYQTPRFARRLCLCACGVRVCSYATAGGATAGVPLLASIFFWVKQLIH